MLEIKRFDKEHLNEALKIWENDDGIGICSSDTPEKISYFLKKNPSSCFVAKNDEILVGTILCGNDGRRGYIYHLCVKNEYRNNGIGESLLTASLNSLSQAGIEKCHLYFLGRNSRAFSFYKHNGWKQRNELILMSKNIETKIIH